jgi:hypothetical protein
MTELVVNIDGTAHSIVQPTGLRTDGRRLGVDRYDPDGDQLGYFTLGMEGWWFRTEDVWAVRDLRLNGHAITDKSTPIAGSSVVMKLAGSDKSAERRGTKAWAVFSLFATLFSSVVVGLITNKLPTVGPWADRWYVLVPGLFITTAACLVAAVRSGG